MTVDCRSEVGHIPRPQGRPKGPLGGVAVPCPPRLRLTVEVDGGRCRPPRKARKRPAGGTEAVGEMGRSDHATGFHALFIRGLCGVEGRRKIG